VRAERKAELAGLTKAKAFYSSKETVLGPCYAFTYAVSMRFECEFLCQIEAIDNSIRHAYDSTVIHF
jgi:hypothetical protein